MVTNLNNVISSLPVRSQRDLSRSTLLVSKSISAHVKKVIRISEGDKIRSLRWLVWSRRHGIPLSYVIAKCFEWGTGATSKRQQFRRRENIFPISVAAMTGKMCYEWLLEQIAQDFDNNPASETLRQKMLLQVLVQPAVSRGKLLDFATLEAYADDYSDHVSARRKAREDAELLLRGSKPFRNNPFR